MTHFLPRSTTTRASLIFTTLMGTSLIVTAIMASSLAPIVLWFVGLFVVGLLWLVTRRW